MGLKVKYSVQFEDAIESLFANVPLYYGERTILKLLYSIEEYKSILIDNPCLGQVEPCLKDFPYVFRRIVVKPYFKIIYSVTDDFVVFHDIWDTRMNPSILKNQLIWNL